MCLHMCSDTVELIWKAQHMLGRNPRRCHLVCATCGCDQNFWPEIVHRRVFRIQKPRQQTTTRIQAHRWSTVPCHCWFWWDNWRDGFTIDCINCCGDCWQCAEIWVVFVDCANSMDIHSSHCADSDPWWENSLHMKAMRIVLLVFPVRGSSVGLGWCRIRTL